MTPVRLEGIISIRDLLPLSIEQMIERFNDVLTMQVQFDDGTVKEVNGRKTILSSLYWDFHRRFPELPLLEHHHIGDRLFGNKVHSQLLSSGLWECFDQGICRDMDVLTKMVMVIFNNVFVFTGEELEEYVTSISAMDYLELLRHPKIVEAKAKARPSTASIEQLYREISHVVMTCPTLNDNAIAMACRASLIGTGPVNQAIAARGFITDYDSNIFRQPVMKGYAEGHTTLADSAMESRSGTKALKATHEPLKKTEYFGRKISILNQYVNKLMAGDCGTTHTVEFLVTKKSLKNLNGKFHVLTDGSLEEIGVGSTHLEGKMIKLRSPLACKHRHHYNTCEVCAGTLSYSIPSDMYYRQRTRLGQICAIALCSFVTQSVMSTKHEDGSSVAEHLNIEERDAAFIKLNTTDPSKIHFQMDLKEQEPKLIIQEEYVKYLEDINNPEVENVSILPTTTLAAMEMIVIRRMVPNSKGVLEPIENPIPTSVGPRHASFTYEFLEYLKKYGWERNSYGDYVIDLAHWRFSKPFLVMPQRHMNMLEYMQSISAFIEKKSASGLSGCKTSAEALRKIYDIVNSRADVNILHLEVLLLASLAKSKMHNDSAAPAVGHDEFNVHRENMFNRSKSAGMAFERHKEIIKRPQSYTNTNVPDHNFDALLMG